MVGRFLASVTLVAWCASAHAEGPVVGGRNPRAIGRAGVGTVSDDGGGALLVNPAAIARRDATRIQLGLSFLDDEMFWIASRSAPAARDQSSSRLLPLVAIEGAIGNWVVGVSAGTTARSERELRRPGVIPASELGNSFEYRYTGLAGSIRRDTVTAGGAYRVNDSVAVGLSVAASRVAISEARRLWAGDANRVVFGVPKPDTIGDPAHDVELAMSATDSLSPSAVAGVLVAPEDSRIELGLSVGWSAPARVSGDITAAGTSPNVSALAGGGTARLDVTQPVAVHSGVRWLGERLIAEVGGDLWWFPTSAEQTSWAISGVTLTDTTVATVPESIELTSLTSRISSRSHAALRGAVDVELISGFLWATTGYAFTSAGTAGSRMSPTFGDLGGHTFALGLETTAGGFTVTFGWARTWSIKVPEPTTRWQLDNPFGLGNAAVPAGTYDGSTDMLGVSIDADLGGE